MPSCTELAERAQITLTLVASTNPHPAFAVYQDPAGRRWVRWGGIQLAILVTLGSVVDQVYTGFSVDLGKKGIYYF